MVSWPRHEEGTGSHSVRHTVKEQIYTGLETRKCSTCGGGTRNRDGRTLQPITWACPTTSCEWQLCSGNMTRHSKASTPSQSLYNLESFIIFIFHSWPLFKLFTYSLIYCACVSTWRSEDIFVGSLFLPGQSWISNSGHWAWWQVHLPAEPSCQPFLCGLLGWFVHVSQSNGKNGHRNCGEGQPLGKLLCKERYQGCWWQLSFQIWSTLNTSFFICILLGSHLR